MRTRTAAAAAEGTGGWEGGWWVGGWGFRGMGGGVELGGWMGWSWLGGWISVELFVGLCHATIEDRKNVAEKGYGVSG